MCPCKVPNLLPGSNYELGEMDEVLYIIVHNGFFFFFKMKQASRKVDSSDSILLGCLILTKII